MLIKNLTSQVYILFPGILPNSFNLTFQQLQLIILCINTCYISPSTSQSLFMVTYTLYFLKTIFYISNKEKLMSTS